MHYLLVFTGLIAFAAILAISPLVPRLLDYLFLSAETESPPAKAAKAANPQATERSEMRDEIRRLTAALETDYRGPGRMKELR